MRLAYYKREYLAARQRDSAGGDGLAGVGAADVATVRRVLGELAEATLLRPQVGAARRARLRAARDRSGAHRQLPRVARRRPRPARQSHHRHQRHHHHHVLPHGHRISARSLAETKQQAGVMGMVYDGEKTRNAISRVFIATQARSRSSTSGKLALLPARRDTYARRPSGSAR